MSSLVSDDELGSEPPGSISNERVNPQNVGMFVGTSGKQPNFLQKLYEFMALDPHPCPEIIYWAADSKQLVIAQPDKLAKEILPRLFKHDKMSSFGRQLNIYGFSRMYPGRQFKDAEGRVSDASVWSHPTLTRMSSPSEVLNVKRRAAPKLFRTRRLANGQLVRTRAGPGVEAKFKEVRDEMAESRRTRGLPGAENAGHLAAGRSYAFVQDDPQLTSPIEHRSTIFPGSTSTIAHSSSSPQSSNNAAVTRSRSSAHPLSFTHHQQSPHKQFWDRGKEQHFSHLESISEDAPSSWEHDFSGITESAPVTTSTTTQVFDTTHESNYRLATSPPNDIVHDTFAVSQVPFQFGNDVPFGVLVPDTNHAPTSHPLSIAVQSCPASIHTSPVLRARDPPPAPPFIYPQLSLSPGDDNPFYGLNFPQGSPSQAIGALQELQNSQQHHAHPTYNQGIRITQPAAPNPFALSISPTPAPISGLSESLGNQDPLAMAIAAISAASSPTSYSSISPIHSARPSMIWEQNGIDPRLISPADSLGSTPAVTPRSGSPVNKAPRLGDFWGGQY